MPLDPSVRERIEQALRIIDETGARGPRLIEDAHRLWCRVQSLIRMDLVAEMSDIDAMELASLAVQLPMRRTRALGSRANRANLRDRAEEAAEQLIEIAAGEADDDLLDRTARLLHEMPHRQPMLDEAKLLADAINLDDFGVVGLLNHSISVGRQGEGVEQIAQGYDLREQYGYWDARLKDGFHFDVVRDIARRRLDHARHVCLLLRGEMNEDRLATDPPDA